MLRISQETGHARSPAEESHQSWRRMQVPRLSETFLHSIPVRLLSTGLVPQKRQLVGSIVY